MAKFIREFTNFTADVNELVRVTKEIIGMYGAERKTYCVFSMDTESCGNNPRSVGIVVFLIAEQWEGDNLLCSTAQTIGGMNVNVLSPGATMQSECEAVDRAALGGARTLDEFWINHRTGYENINATSIPAGKAIEYLNEFRAAFASFTKVVLSARPLAYDYMVLQRLYDNNGAVNPFPPFGSSAFCMGTALAMRYNPGATNSINFNQFVGKLPKRPEGELTHDAMQDADDQFRAYWIALQEKYGKNAYPDMQN
jgi:cytidine deaminase